MLHDESVDDHFDVQPGVPNQIREVQNEWTGTKIVGNNINALTAMGFKRKRGGEQNAEEVGTQERGKLTTREVEEEEEQDVPEVLPQLACKAAVKRARMASSAARACAGAAATAHAVLANLRKGGGAEGRSQEYEIGTNTKSIAGTTCRRGRDGHHASGGQGADK
jgi:hypothetical protein